MFSPSDDGILEPVDDASEPVEVASGPVEEASEVGELFVNAVYVAVPVKLSVEVLCAMTPAITINSDNERVEVLIFCRCIINLANEY